MVAPPTEDAMKTALLALLAALALGACHHDEPKTTPTPPADKPPPANNNQLQQVTTDQKVSPNIALSGDLIQLCGIKPPAESANPNFDYDKDELTPEDRTVLDQLATCLTTGPLKGKNISLIGRADPRGTEEYNLGLGSRRASSVSTYLVHLGVQQGQLGVTTRGSLDATGTDESGWSKDRRVDIQLKQS
jgi:peptidoglycan-associated lipoprotein